MLARTGAGRAAAWARAVPLRPAHGGALANALPAMRRPASQRGGFAGFVITSRSSLNPGGFHASTNPMAILIAARRTPQRGPFGRWNTATHQHAERRWLPNGQEFQVASGTIVLAARVTYPNLCDQRAPPPRRPRRSFPSGHAASCCASQGGRPRFFGLAIGAELGFRSRNGRAEALPRIRTYVLFSP